MSQPKVSRPVMPKGYGIQKSKTGLLAWSHVEDRMSAAKNYWVCTTRPDGRPHAMPVWGVWIDRKFYFGTDRNSRKGRNLARQPTITVHLESGDDAVIVEGSVDEIKKCTPLIDDAYRAKYGMALSEAPGDSCFYCVTPGKVLAWREKDFPTCATRWVFSD